MESALDRVTGEVVDAEQLWLLDEVDRERYACRGCGVKVLPASYRPTNLVRPYFTVGSAGAHRRGCDVDGEQGLVQRGRQHRVTTSRDGFPAPYPSSLVLKDSREIVDKESAASDAPRGGGRAGPAQSSHGGPAVPRKRAVGTIRQICRTFINFPYDRDLALSVPGVEADKYYGVFKKLKWDEMLRYPMPKIFYAALRWAKPVEDDACIEIGLDAGRREGRKLAVGHRVRIEWGGWSDARKAFVRKEIEVAREEAKQAFRGWPEAEESLRVLPWRSGRGRSRPVPRRRPPADLLHR